MKKCLSILINWRFEFNVTVWSLVQLILSLYYREKPSTIFWACWLPDKTNSADWSSFRGAWQAVWIKRTWIHKSKEHPSRKNINSDKYLMLFAHIMINSLSTIREFGVAKPTFGFVFTRDRLTTRTICHTLQLYPMSHSVETWTSPFRYIKYFH